MCCCSDRFSSHIRQCIVFSQKKAWFKTRLTHEPGRPQNYPLHTELAQPGMHLAHKRASLWYYASSQEDKPSNAPLHCEIQKSKLTCQNMFLSGWGNYVHSGDGALLSLRVCKGIFKSSLIGPIERNTRWQCWVCPRRSCGDQHGVLWMQQRRETSGSYASRARDEDCHFENRQPSRIVWMTSAGIDL